MKQARNSIRHARVFVVFGVLSFILILAGSGSVSTQELDLSTIMERKLDDSHNILSSLVLEDFEGLEESAESMLELADASLWFSDESSSFVLRMNEFRRSVEQIAVSAKARDGNAAALAYVDMTLKCVGCHQQLRRVRMAEIPDGLQPTDPRPAFTGRFDTAEQPKEVALAGQVRQILSEFRVN